MKRIRLTVGREIFVIEESEGRAEIRAEAAPKVDADRKTAAIVRLTMHDRERDYIWVDLAVEAIE